MKQLVTILILLVGCSSAVQERETSTKPTASVRETISSNNLQLNDVKNFIKDNQIEGDLLFTNIQLFCHFGGFSKDISGTIAMVNDDQIEIYRIIDSKITHQFVVENEQQNEILDICKSVVSGTENLSLRSFEIRQEGCGKPILMQDGCENLFYVEFEEMFSYAAKVPVPYVFQLYSECDDQFKKLNDLFVLLENIVGDSEK